MNTIIKPIAVAAVMTIGLSSCLEEYLPTDQATGGQIENADKSSLSNAVAAYMTTYSSSYDYDAGFPGFGIWRDAMTADLPIVYQPWDYFPFFNTQTTLGDYGLQTLFWQRYYYLVQKADDLLRVANPDEIAADAVYAGNALTYRAMAYLDMMRMYEYRPTGVPDLDQRAEERGIYGLTVPIVTEKTTEADARNNPRVPFYHMYRFILDDLTKAEGYLAETHSVSTKTNASIGVVYGMKARLWLEMASRFDLAGEDLQLALQHEDDPELDDLARLDISSATDCYRNAAEYARKAISEGYTPTTESQWFDPSSGFNTPINSWMWCVTISPDDPAATSRTYSSFVSFMSVEASWGISTYEYGCGRMVDAALYRTIPDADWRKTTWIDPSDVASQSAYNTKYAKGTSLGYDEWKLYGAYVGFKFHPGNGDKLVSTVGNAVSTPLMRVEEMYLIEAEAAAHVSGLGEGQRLLETFVNNYRYSDGSFKSTATDIDSFTDEVFAQRRIEFWGEGLILWDYSRLRKAIVRGYIGTNHPEEYQYNSYPNRVAPWSILYIPDSENNYNPAVILNPDPSKAIAKWVG